MKTEREYWAKVSKQELAKIEAMSKQDQKDIIDRLSFLVAATESGQLHSGYNALPRGASAPADHSAVG